MPKISTLHLLNWCCPIGCKNMGCWSNFCVARLVSMGLQMTKQETERVYQKSLIFGYPISKTQTGELKLTKCRASNC